MELVWNFDMNGRYPAVDPFSEELKGIIDGHICTRLIQGKTEKTVHIEKSTELNSSWKCRRKERV